MLSLIVSQLSAITTGAPCTITPGNDVVLKWNAYASEWGMYEIEGCTGISPKLSLAAGNTYTFVQTDASNWYHPVGFSYIAGGAHTTCLDSNGDEGECPEVGGTAEAAASAATESVLQYYVDNVAITSDESGFGLDGYEPLFFNSLDWWGEHTFKVTLTIPAAPDYTRLYYFCHIHAGMSAEIEITGSSAASSVVIDPLQLGAMTQVSAQAIFTDIVAHEQPTISAFDETCGTHGSSAYDPASNSQCSNKHFLCGESSGTFNECLSAIDCQMHYDMAVAVTGTSKFATFARQMIPHHQNAVSMAKVLHKHMRASDFPTTEDMDMDWAEGLILSIINVQNAQIQQMQGWLEGNPALAGATTVQCYDEYGEPETSSSSDDDDDDDDDGIALPVFIGVAVAAAVVGALIGLLVGMKMNKKPAAAPKPEA